VSIVNIEQGRQRIQLHTLVSIAIATEVDLKFFFPDLETGSLPVVSFEVFGEKKRDKVIKILEKVIDTIKEED
jgi:transcriptional regulator with XRE-family HTH domain